MAVDYGDTRTGLATSDSGESLAFPAGVIIEKDMYKVAGRIRDKIQDAGVELIVVGLPKNMDGTEGNQAGKCRMLVELIEQLQDKPVVTWDERVTTKIATEYMNQTDTRGKKRRERIDEVAATVILQSYLDYRKNLLSNSTTSN